MGLMYIQLDTNIGIRLTVSLALKLKAKPTIQVIHRMMPRYKVYLGRRYANGHYQVVKVTVVICEPTQILDPVDGRCCDVLTFLLFRSGHPRHPLTQGLGQHLRQRVHITQDDVVFERECVQVPLHLDLHFPVHLLVCDTLHIQDR